MNWFIQITSNSRLVRHILFWLLWIIGFTFIKSFGEGLEVYYDWFVYYIITLPVFVAHTYIIVYWMGRKVTRAWTWLLFALLFFVLMYFFSVLELLISHEILAKWIPALFETEDKYLTTGNIIINGIGNLYIILVFIATKVMRKWYLSMEERKGLNQKLLEDQVAIESSKIQPGLLMYAAERMEEMAKAKSEDISSAIAGISEIMNGTMLTRDHSMHRIDEEFKLIKKLLQLHSIFDGRQAPQIQVNGADLDNSMVPALAIFSVMEVSLRTIKKINRIIIDLIIPAKPTRVHIKWEMEGEGAELPDIISLSEQIDQFFPGRFVFQSSLKERQYMLSMEEKI